ncbi:glycoside hydrolase family 43 protein [Vibrio cholerae]|uniref:glycoside hydrolase family 43 protein n=1 Tax=Vibrio TaxID=662 RepID=UPI0004E46859|nr:MULTISPECIES: glycoside hydrolase family 43 protein [Vibrio]KFD81851.1 xylan beta-1,4-xylosidase [Vibrio paracholerae]QAV06902.1 Beta-xylosidase [Vibrio cholerae]TXX92299.1 glycoside hydrolase family 43 protein [Vibrio cholerae]TXX93505.1 glycoside hydrolase family 43 protein [Vibrio cholerae]GHW11538.1 beta-xylosidase [Vibrio cholerae]
MAQQIQNPILKGFNPDPSIVRVGDDYYIATSTFEWFPGVQIHHSKDLVNWRLIGHALTRKSQLDMRGMDNSEGVYAPALSYSDNKFWLCFSNVHSCRGGNWMATPSYVVTADNIEGPWSDPIHIGSYGFDPSLFHDDDGKKYMLNMVWDGRENTNFFGGIVLQEYDPQQESLIGERQIIFNGTKLGCTEGPQILKQNGYYYLITAEGGTAQDHAVTVCRSRNIWGPYEVHPDNPILTSRFQETAELSRAGHGFFVETQNGEWYLSHLCGRRIPNPEGYQYIPEYNNGFSILGRESALQKAHWRDNWPYVSTGKTPKVNVEAPDLPVHPWPKESIFDDFDSDSLSIHFQSLNEPLSEDWISLNERESHVRLYGRHYLSSRYEQSLIARRFQSFYATAETKLEFSPTTPLEMAGLCCYYSRNGHYFLKVSASDAGQRVIQIVGNINNHYSEFSAEVSIPSEGPVWLKVELNKQWYYFSYSMDGTSWQRIGRDLNSTPLSDEGGPDIFRFTGSFVGLFACDISGQKKHADFDHFSYQEHD